MTTKNASGRTAGGNGIYDPTSVSGYVEGVSNGYPDEDARARAGRRRAGTVVSEAQVKKHPLPGDGLQDGQLYVKPTARP